MHPDLNQAIRVLGAALLLSATVTLGACADDEGVPLPPVVEQGPTSPHPRVRFKGPERLQMELSRVLGLESDALCNELDLYDCVAVHNVALGGVDPFGSALYNPTETSTPTTTLAVERLVLRACIERSARDFTSGAPVIFVGLAPDELDPASAEVAQAVDALYTRALQRHAKPRELEHLGKLYRDIEASADATMPGREWATLSCFTVLTSLEFLFY